MFDNLEPGKVVMVKLMVLMVTFILAVGFFISVAVIFHLAG
jgi:hypothetical protein